jgi:hypothetical protein
MPDVAILTPVKRTQADNLRIYLRGLRGRPGVFDLLKPTHFARFVVIWTGGPYLLFSSRFDGETSDYLGRLASIREAQAIWAHCERPAPASEQNLRDYLKNERDHVRAEYVVDAFGKYEPFTVDRVNRALKLRDDMLAFIGRSRDLDAIALAHEFRQLEYVRYLLSR